ncbi:MAG: GMC oxidoreductase [Gemmatimonadaceae bacterium]
MATHLVVGSGASGVHYALSVLERGESVVLLDVGYERPLPQFPDATSAQLKELLADPLGDILGVRGECVVYPGPTSKPYGFPPGKAYVFRAPDTWSLTQRGFDPLVSFARGGLAEAWTGGAYELHERDLAPFPITLGEVQPHYATVARRIGLTGVHDDLERFSPMSAEYDAPLPLDAHSQRLLDAYAARRGRINSLGASIGRSRVAVLTSDRNGRRACTQLGRCLAGCPRESLYAPSYTLRDMARFPGFRYVPGIYVERINLDGNGTAVGVVARDVAGMNEQRFAGDRVVLAAGTLATTRLYLATLQHEFGAAPELTGLMDNRHVMIPFVTPTRVGSGIDQASYQFHHLAFGIHDPVSRSEAHGQITTLKASSVHPIVATLPFDFATSLRVFRRIRGALGVANMWLADTRRAPNSVSLDPGSGGLPRLVLHYGDDTSDLTRTRAAIATFRQVLARLGAVAPPGNTRVLARGSSVHYAGTIPMTAADEKHTCRPDGSVRGLDRLFVVDGASFSSLPAKNLTLTLMANAARVAAIAG